MSRASAAAARRQGAGTAPPERRIRLMLVDDSATARAVLTRMLETEPGFDIVAEASSAAEALGLLGRNRVDIILLDLEMPGTSGLTALPDILAKGRGALVFVLSSQCEDGAEASVRALALGAVETMAKPGASVFGGRFAQLLAQRLRALVPEPAASSPPSRAPRPLRAEPKLRAMSDARLGCLAIGASTGGLRALVEFISALPKRVGAPILVTQHLPSAFVASFARQLQSACGRPASVAEQGARLVSDHILVAPGDSHLCVERVGGQVCVSLGRGAAESRCMPSVDPMFESAARLFGPAALGVVLTGMGRDGFAGAKEIALRGGTLLVQDAESAAVWGMPGALAEAGLASAVAPPAELARLVAKRIGAARCS